MNKKDKIIAGLTWALLVVVIVAIVLFFIKSETGRVKLPIYAGVQPFTLTNQFDQRFDSTSLLGKVWVADVIFTRCAGPCPKMTEKMNDLATHYQDNDRVEFVTITTDPGHDTPKVLKQYAKSFGGEGKRWHFLTGEKPAIQKAAVDSLKMVATEKLQSEQENPNDLFIHTTVFVLVDKLGRIRGTYESLEPGFEDKIRTAINSLVKERI